MRSIAKILDTQLFTDTSQAIRSLDKVDDPEIVILSVPSSSNPSISSDKVLYPAIPQEEMSGPYKVEQIIIIQDVGFQLVSEAQAVLAAYQTSLVANTVEEASTYLLESSDDAEAVTLLVTASTQDLQTLFATYNLIEPRPKIQYLAFPSELAESLELAKGFQ